VTENRNVVLVTVDSLRADFCGFMGSDRGLTPNLDRHADAGLVFEHAVAPGPSTLDAMPGVFTGADLVDGRGDESPRTRVRHHLRARETIAERFAARGYDTAGFTANPWTSRGYGFDAGFDHFEDFLDDGNGSTDGTSTNGGDEARGSAPTSLRLLRRWTGESNMFQSWDSFYEDAVAWTASADEPYFLWLFLVDAHMPYLPVEAPRSQSWLWTYAANLWLYLTGHDAGRLEWAFRDALIRAYEDTVRYTDRRFDRLLGDLADDDPVVVFHADHGEAFGEGGVYGHGPRLSEEQVHVPLLVANGPTGRVDRPFSLCDLSDLLLALGAGEGDIDDLTEPYVGTRNRDPKFALRGRAWKYIEDGGDATLTAIDEEDPSLPASDLRSMAEAEVTRWKAHERERTRVAEAAREVAAVEDL